MKTFRLIGMALMAVLMSFSLAACSDDDDDEDNGSSSSSIAGIWRGTETEYSLNSSGEWEVVEKDYIALYFSEDGAFAGGSGSETYAFLDDFGLWSLNGNTLTITWYDYEEYGDYDDEDELRTLYTSKGSLSSSDIKANGYVSYSEKLTISLSGKTLSYEIIDDEDDNENYKIVGTLTKQ